MLDWSKLFNWKIVVPVVALVALLLIVCLFVLGGVNVRIRNWDWNRASRETPVLDGIEKKREARKEKLREDQDERQDDRIDRRKERLDKIVDVVKRKDK